MNLKEIGWDDVDWIHLAQDRDQWVPGALSLAAQQQELEADHSSKSSAEVKNAWSYTSTPQIRL
jgi:hypothetical protein